jgi:hypothetical protein
MDGIEIVKSAYATIEAGKLSKFADMLTEDLVFSGPVPEPIGKREYVGLITALVAAIPDWKFNGKDFKQIGDKVTVTVQVTGTQTGELKIPLPGFPKVPATRKRISLDKQPTTFTIKSNKICRIEAEPSARTGVPGILAQLGVAMPQMA